MIIIINVWRIIQKTNQSVNVEFNESREGMVLKEFKEFKVHKGKETSYRRKAIMRYFIIMP